MGRSISNFDTTAQFAAFSATTEFKTPHVTLIKEQGGVGFFKYDYSKDYFTMVITTGGNVRWTGSTTANTLSYSKDNGTTWNTTDRYNTMISVAAGDKVLWKGTPTLSNKGIGKFTGDANARYSVEGNVMSLLYGDDFTGQTSLSGAVYALCDLFNGNINVTSAENMSLPATTLVSNCYSYMFRDCTSLNYIKAMFTTTPSSIYMNSWVSGVASSGTFVKNAAATWNVTGTSAVPSGWTVETASS